MAEQTPLISVVIAAYRPGDGFQRVMDSLDAQTLPQDRFETVVVDDGSGDDTLERLRALAAARGNMRVETIENSGWPSRPRNVGTDLAAAPYVLYVDHDDSIYPDALRRLAEFAAETKADVVSTKEALTSAIWWGTEPFRDGNIANVLEEGDIHRLMPMMPHKLYRKAFLQEHGVRFPEGRRQLWEDIYFNVAAWRHAEVIALLADAPVYLWHSSTTNNSSTYGPSSKEFWDRIDLLFDYVDRTLDGPAFARAREDELVHQWRARALKRFAKLAGTAVGPRVDGALPRAQAVQRKYLPVEMDPKLGPFSWSRSVLTRIGRTDLLGELWRLEEDLRVEVRGSALRWVDGVLELEVTAGWVEPSGKPVRLLRRGDRLVRDLPAAIRDVLPPEALDMTDSLDALDLRIGLHSRADHITWEVQVPRDIEWRDVGSGAVTPVARAAVRIDPRTAAAGTPLTPGVWEVAGLLKWADSSRGQGVKLRTTALPALPDGFVAVAYTNKAGTLALDLSGASRNAVGDGGMRAGRVPGTADAFSLPLPRVRAWQDQDVPLRVHLEPLGRPEGAIELPGRLRAVSGAVRLDTGGRVPPGEYRLAFQSEGGVLRYGRWVAQVGAAGRIRLQDRLAEPDRPVLLRSKRLTARVAKRVIRALPRPLAADVQRRVEQYRRTHPSAS